MNRPLQRRSKDLPPPWHPNSASGYITGGRSPAIVRRPDGVHLLHADSRASAVFVVQRCGQQNRPDLRPRQRTPRSCTRRRRLRDDGHFPSPYGLERRRGSLPRRVGSRHAVTQCRSLLANAIKFSESGAIIAIVTHLNRGITRLLSHSRPPSEASSVAVALAKATAEEGFSPTPGKVTQA